MPDRNTSFNKSAAHLADYKELYEPARSNNFEFIVTDIDNILSAGTNFNGAQDSDYIKDGQDVIRISVAEASVPHFSLGTIEIARGNSRVKFAGVPTFDSGTLVLNDYIGARTKDALMAWQALAYDVVSEKVHWSYNYKKDCQLIEYTPDYEQIIRIWDLKGCWVSAVSEGNFSADSNEKRTVSATIVYDKAIPHKEDEIVTM
jgi:hypothetical protein